MAIIPPGRQAFVCGVELLGMREPSKHIVFVTNHPAGIIGLFLQFAPCVVFEIGNDIGIATKCKFDDG